MPKEEIYNIKKKFNARNFTSALNSINVYVLIFLPFLLHLLSLSYYLQA